ncbi:hypothetical protein BH23THE1_BH23THE1_30710 [soil metagenome]
MKYILTVFLCFFLSNSVTDTDKELRVVKTLGQGILYYPAGPLPMFSYGSFVVIENQKLLLFDSAGIQPFYLIDVEGGNFETFGQWGRGPGEFLKESPKLISVTDDIYIYDVYNHFLHKFTLNMKYVESFLPELKSNMFASVMMIDDETLLFSDHGVNMPGETVESYFLKFNFKEGDVSGEPISLLPYESLDDLLPIKGNISLKSGPVVLFDDTIYLANLFGSVIFGIDKNGTQSFYTNLPEKAGIPETEIRLVNGVRVGEPEIPTFHNLDLAVDQEYLYALYSGVTSTYENISNFMTGGTLDDALRIGEGKMLRIYDRRNGAYLGEFSLPNWAAAITVDEEYIYAVVWDDEPHIMVLDKPLK